MEVAKSQRTIGYLMLFLAATFWAMTGVMGLAVKKAGVGPMEVAFWRALIGGGLFILHAFVSKNYHVERKDRLIFMAFGLPGVAILFYGFQLGVQNVGMAMATMLQYTSTAWIVVWGVVFFKEQLTIWKVTAAAMAIAGAVILCLAGGNIAATITFAGVAGSLISGICYSLHSPFGKKFMQKYSPISIYMHTMPMGALFMLPFVTFADKTPEVWAWLVGLSVVTVWAAYWCYCEGVKRIEVSKVGVICSIEPVIAAMIGFLFFAEDFSTMGWVGAGFIIVAVFLTLKK